MHNLPEPGAKRKAPEPSGGCPTAKPHWRLTERIVDLSIAPDWYEAKQEWFLEDVYLTEEPGTCLCGHRIIEHCIIRNRENGNSAVVGNCCVKRFMDLPSERLFTALRRIYKDLRRALNAETIEHAYRRGWIDDWQRGFYLNTLKKRQLSEKQLAKRREINAKVLARATRTGGLHHAS
jgi:hypothetical protein